MLGRDADEIRVADVYHEFVFRSQELHADAEATFERQLVRLTGGIQEDLSMSLERLFGTPPQEPARGRGRRDGLLRLADVLRRPVAGVQPA